MRSLGFLVHGSLATPSAAREILLDANHISDRVDDRCHSGEYSPVFYEYNHVVGLRPAPLHRIRRRHLDQHLGTCTEHQYRCLLFAPVLHEDAEGEQGAPVRSVVAYDLIAGRCMGPS